MQRTWQIHPREGKVQRVDCQEKYKEKCSLGKSSKGSQEVSSCSLPVASPLSDVSGNELPNRVPQETISVSNGVPAETLSFIFSTVQLACLTQISTYHFTLFSWVVLSTKTLCTCVNILRTPTPRPAPSECEQAHALTHMHTDRLSISSHCSAPSLRP